MRVIEISMAALGFLAGCSGATHPDHAPVHPAPSVAAVANPAGPPTRLDARRPSAGATVKPDALLEMMSAELHRSMDALAKQPDAPYFASYQAGDARNIEVSASFGALDSSNEYRHRWVDIDVRAGDYKLDNRHGVRGTRFGRGDTHSVSLPLENDDYAIRSILWLETDAGYKAAAEQLKEVQAAAQVTVKQDDDSDDFSHEKPFEHFEAPATISVDRAAWERRLRELSAVFRSHPEILWAQLSLSVGAETDYFVSSEGTRYQLPSTHARLTISAATRVEDGAELHRMEAFDVATPDRLPSDAAIRAKIDQVIGDLERLKKAPVVEPYSGPAILEGKAAAVFFHEVFGHRIEGHRQKDDSEGQTFAKKIGQAITADFLDVFDDPTIDTLNGIDLNGYYEADDEGVPAQKVNLIEHGVLKTFLLNRSPTRGFVHSNGHGRRQLGHPTVARQGNLIATASHTVDRATLRRMLLDEVKKQGKPYGMIFKELDGGFTMTERFSPQAFKLLPLMVYRLYPDGREELVRGADLEGTPLTALGDIRAAGDDFETFNGFCGAESGMVAVSASSPSLLVSHVEVTKKEKTNSKLPVLPPPPVTGGKP